MRTSDGWVAFVGNGVERVYLVAMANGQPEFSSEIDKARFRDEVTCRQSVAILRRLGIDARAQYVPYAQRRSFLPTDIWSANHAY